MAAGDYASTRYSALSTIDTSNVSKLKVAFTFSTGVDRGQEAAPLVVGDTMYIVTPFPNTVYRARSDQARRAAEVEIRAATRSRRAGGRLLRRRQSRRRATGRARSSSTPWTATPSRSTPHTGKERWRSQLGDINKGETITMAPLVVKGKVLVGNAGGEFGVRGWLRRSTSPTASVAWKAYNTGPDADVLIGAGLQAVLRERPRQGSGRHDLAAGCLEDRRRHGVGLDLLRSRART